MRKRETPCQACRQSGFLVLSPEKTIECPFCLGKGVRVFTPPREISSKELYENSQNIMNENYGLKLPIEKP